MMANADAFDEAAKRLNRALDGLDGLLKPPLGDDAAEALRAEIAALGEERYRLVGDLGRESERSRRLEQANDAVSERIDALLETLRSLSGRE